MTDRREPPLEDLPPGVPDSDGPPQFVDAPERDPGRGHLIFVALALALMVVAWWGL
jgi:hypothetical protein